MGPAASWGRLECQPGDIAMATEMVTRFDPNLHLPDAIHIAIAIDVTVFNPLQEP